MTYFTLVLLYFSSPLGSLMPALLSVDENRVPLKAVLGGLWDVARILYPSCTDSSNRVCNSLVILLWLMHPRDHFVSRFLYFTTTGVKYCVAAVKSCRYFTSVLLCFSCPSESLMPAFFSVENWLPLLSTQGAWGMLHVFSIPHVQTQSNRVRNSLANLLWLIVPRDHFVSSFLI
jgi:hypothetical protein